MTYPTVPLTRFFSPVAKSEQETDERDFQTFLGSSKRVSWEEIEGFYRCVVLAEAGSGKTHEMKKRADSIKNSGRTAFFIRIEEISGELEDAFEVGDAMSFNEWLDASEEAWFFLDALDEARLEHPKAFERAIKLFARKIKPALNRAHIYVSGRPYSWRAKTDHDFLDSHLPFSNSAYSNVHMQQQIQQEGDTDKDKDLKVFLLEPLNEEDIRLFASYRSAVGVDKLIISLQRANLMSMAARPFDLDGILKRWEDTQQLDGRLHSLRHNIEFRLDEFDSTRKRRQPLNNEKALSGARLLAAAVMLSGKPGIRIPEATHDTRGIDAAIVLGSDWEDREIQALLERGVFNDAIYGMVRFRHREERELLAAEWFHHQLHSGLTRHSITSLFIREQYGLTVITPRLRPVLTWLVLMDSDLLHQVLDIAPEIAIEGGDASLLPVRERRILLKRVIERIAKSPGVRTARNNEAIARIAQVDLSHDALALMKEYSQNDNVIFFLARLAWQGELTLCVPALIETATDLNRDIYSRVAATRAVMTCGKPEQKLHLWTVINTLQERMQYRLLYELVERAPSDIDAVRLMFTSIGRLDEPQRFQSNELGPSLIAFIQKIGAHPTEAHELLIAVVESISNFVGQYPYNERVSKQVSAKYAWVLFPVITAIDKLIGLNSRFVFSPISLSLMLRVTKHRYHPDSINKHLEECLRKMIASHKELNDALFWYEVEEFLSKDVGEFNPLSSVWHLLMSSHTWSFCADRFDDVLAYVALMEDMESKQIALSLAYWMYSNADKPEHWHTQLISAADAHPSLESLLAYALTLTKPRVVKSQQLVKREQELCAREEKYALWIQSLKANPGIVRFIAERTPCKMSNDQISLLAELEGKDATTGRENGAKWQNLIPKFGTDVAEAYRDAAISFWRNYRPGLRSEGDNTTYVSDEVLFAMAGLNIESREFPNFTEKLSEREVRNAMRYVVRRMEGLPEWLKPLYDTHPDSVTESVLVELFWELENTPANHSLYYIAHNLVHYAKWMHERLKPVIFDWLSANTIENPSLILDCLHIMQSGKSDILKIIKLAKYKAASSTNSAPLSVWYALWVDLDASNAIPAFEKYLLSLKADVATVKAQEFITYLIGHTHHEKGIKFTRDFNNAGHLKSLIILMHQYIRVEEDFDRTKNGAYSPTLRDEAQHCRDQLMSWLSSIPGKETFVAYSELKKESSHGLSQLWLTKLAYEHAEKDADEEPWSAHQIRDFNQQQFRTPSSHRQLYDLSINHLIDLKFWLEHGNDSPYQTWRRADNEAEMRNLVAGWLNNKSSGRFVCAQENELANKQRPDIWIQSPKIPSPVPIELKLLDQGWSGSKLCERLRNQLAGDYLRGTPKGCGILLLIWQGTSSQTYWEINSRKVTLEDLAKTLQDYWHGIAGQFAHVDTIKVMVIDLRVRDGKSGT